MSRLVLTLAGCPWKSLLISVTFGLIIYEIGIETYTRHIARSGQRKQAGCVAEPLSGLESMAHV